MILDSSAFIALLREEPGAEIVRQHVDGAAMSTANLTQTGDFFLRQGISKPDFDSAVRPFNIVYEPVTYDIALEASALYVPTRHRPFPW